MGKTTKRRGDGGMGSRSRYIRRTGRREITENIEESSSNVEDLTGFLYPKTEFLVPRRDQSFVLSNQTTPTEYVSEIKGMFTKNFGSGDFTSFEKTALLNRTIRNNKIFSQMIGEGSRALKTHLSDKEGSGHVNQYLQNYLNDSEIDASRKFDMLGMLSGLIEEETTEKRQELSNKIYTMLEHSHLNRIGEEYGAYRKLEKLEEDPYDNFGSKDSAFVDLHGNLKNISMNSSFGYR